MDTCIPVSPGSKPKQSPEFKLDQVRQNILVPSTIGASFFHMMRRYLEGKTAGNTLEQVLFSLAFIFKNSKETYSHAAICPAFFSACCFPTSNTTFPASSCIQDAVGALQSYP